MATEVQRPSAQIYIFPSRQRTTSSQLAGQVRKAVEPRGERQARPVVSSGWYHEAAIEEAARERKR